MKTNRILIAAPSSGSGKTLFTCGLLTLMKSMGKDVTAFKCGPDYIDPMFHERVLGIGSGNLDTYFSSPAHVAESVDGCGHAYAVIEGVMGIYDGLGGLERKASSMDVAEACAAPVLLIVDAHGAGRTIISCIRGILEDDPGRRIRGIILNRVSAGFYERLSGAVNSALSESGFDARVLGYLPVMKSVKIESRHLGLLRPEEIPDLHQMLETAGGKIAECCEVEKILALMESGSGGEAADEKAQNGTKSGSFKLAVARDEAFCFYYRENLELLKKLGGEIVYFSPLHDRKLPEGSDGIYLGGGYPELYLKELSENTSMLEELRTAIGRGIFSLAECGGFMYLHESIYDEKGEARPMLGVIRGSCEKKERLQRFGYIELHPAGTALPDTTAGVLDGMRGHEFHYYDSTACGTDMTVKKAGDEREWKAMYVGERHVWGFPHLFWGSCPGFAAYLAEVMHHG